MADRSGYAIIVLAAGASRRMGRPKQLLAVGNRPLLRQVTEAAISSGAGKVYVVLGANEEIVRPVLAGLPVEIVLNPEWEEGMGSSIRAGMKALSHFPQDWLGVMLVLGDQPRFSPEYVARLIAARRDSQKSIAAAYHGGRWSPPVLFAPRHFAALSALQGDAGAKKILEANGDEIVAVNVDDPGDLDTPGDYTAFLNESH